MNFHISDLILPIAWAVAVVSVSLAYVIAGEIWRRRHSLSYKIGSRSGRVSGAVGESLLITFAAIMLAIIDMASGDTSIMQIIDTRPVLCAAMLVGVVAIVYLHGLRTARKGDPKERRQLFHTYLVYGIYSTIIFTGGALLTGMLIEQIIVDISNFNVGARKVLDTLQTSAVPGDPLYNRVELAYLDTIELLSSVEDAMTPVFIFMAGIFSINLVLRLTPMRSVFMNDAVLQTQLSTFVGVLAILTVGGYLYVKEYAVFIESMLMQFTALRPAFAEAHPERLVRYVEIVVSLTDQKTLVGFITRMSNDWGGVAATLGVAQWLAEQFNKPEASESEGDLERQETGR